MEPEALRAATSSRPESVESLREAVLRLGATFDHAPVGLAHLLPDGRLQQLNAAAAALLGVAPDGAVGRPVHEFVHPDDRLVFVERLLGLVGGADEALELEVRLQPAEGRARWVRAAATLVREGVTGEAGRPFFCVLVLDALAGDRLAHAARARAAARREAEALVARARDAHDRRLRLALDTMLDCVGIYRAVRDAAGRIVDFRIEYVNEAACANNRMPAEAQVGRLLCELLPAHRTSGLFDAYVRVVESGEPLVQEQRVYRDTYGDGAELERAFEIRAVRLDDGFVAAWRDVTGQVQAALELGATRDRLRAALAASRAGAWRWQAADDALEWDVTLRRLAGLPDEGPIAPRDLDAVVHPDDRARLRLATRQALAGGPPCELELRLVPRGADPATQARWVLGRGEAVRAADGRVTGLHGTVTDVTELVLARRRAERLQAFSAALAGADDADAVYDALLAHGASAIGAAAAAVVRPVPGDADALEIVRSVGYDADALAPWMRFPRAAMVPMGDAFRRAEPVWVATADETVARYPAVAPIVRATGFAGWLAVPFVLGDGAERRVVGGLGVAFAAPHALDAAEREFLVALGGLAAQAIERARAEAARRASEARARSLIEHLPGGAAFVLDHDLRYVLAGGEALAAAGFTAADFVGRTVDEAVEPALAAYYRPLFRRALAGETFAHEHESHGRVYLSRGVPLRDEAGAVTAALAVSYDITERRAVEQERERLLAELGAARDEAEAANRAKSVFLATMSHELRTPLNAIQGHVQLVELGVHGPVTDAQRQALDRVQRAQAHLLGLINDVLAHAKLEAGHMEYDVRPVDVGAALRDAAALVETQLAARGHAFTVRAPEAPCAVLADADRLRQILLNLLANAGKFTPAGGRVTLEVDGCAADDADGLVRVHVRDTGVGIAPAQQAAVFEPFVQLRDAAVAAAPAGGTGLGLAISRELARGMGGELTVASAPGEGSTFTLTLRRAG